MYIELYYLCFLSCQIQSFDEGSISGSYMGASDTTGMGTTVLTLTFLQSLFLVSIVLVSGLCEVYNEDLRQ